MTHNPWRNLPRQKKAATVVLFTILLLVILLDVFIVIGILGGGIDGQAMIGSSLLAILGSPIDATWIRGLLGILAIASAWLAGNQVSNLIYNLFFAMVVLAALLTAFAFVALHTEAIASSLYNHATVESLADSKGFKSAIKWFFGGILGWLIGVAATLIGVRTNAD